MSWEVEYTEEFGKWWDSLKETEQGKLDAAVRLLEEHGPEERGLNGKEIQGS